MLEKNFSIKDVTIYLIPGTVITFFCINLYSDLDGSLFEKLEFQNSYVLTSILTISISFLVGFVFSQIQIILFNKLFRTKFRSVRAIKNIIEIEEFKAKLEARICKVFGDNLKDNLLENDQIVFYCYSYVLEKADIRSIEIINRSKTLASFAKSLFIPFFIVLINLLHYLNVYLCVKFALLVLFSILLWISLRKIVFNFETEFYLNIFRCFFLVKK